MADYKVIGTSQKRYDAVEKVTGAAIYSGDIKPDRMCYGRFVASPHAHANILSIDTSEAEAMPNVVGIITGADVPDKRYGGYLRDRHILCKKTVRFVGDYVALVVATDEVSAANAAAKVKVEYEVLPAIFDVEDAASSNPSIIVHPKLEAMKRQAGRPSKENVSQVGTQKRSDQVMAEELGESRNQMFGARFVRHCQPTALYTPHLRQVAR